MDNSLCLKDFIFQLEKEIVQVILKPVTRNEGNQNGLFYENIIKDISEIGWDCIYPLSNTSKCNKTPKQFDLKKFKIKLKDRKNRKHELFIELNDYPNSIPECIVDLPSPFIIQQIGDHSNKNLKCIIQDFQLELEKYQILWDILDEIDRSCWILDPLKITRSCLYRRISIDNDISLRIEFDIRDMLFTSNQVQDKSSTIKKIFKNLHVEFLGPQDKIKYFQQNFHKNKNITFKTKNNRGFLCLLSDVLGLEHGFPPLPNVIKEENLTECGICYNHRLFVTNKRLEVKETFDKNIERKIPDKICQKQNCRKAFHTECLAEWLHSLTSSEISFNTIFGPCPYCQSTISLPLGKRNLFERR